jgi:mannan endo-1,4-beta-mannosidase
LLYVIALTLGVVLANDITDEPVVRNGSQLSLGGEPWYASGANVYWLGLDQNVIPPPGQPFYASYNASYPTKGRITEIMNTLNVMGANVIRSHTLGISVGNPLSLEPELGRFNDEAFDTIDWSIYQARERGLRIIVPLIDNYDYYHGGKFVFLRWNGINLTYPTTDPRVMEFYTNDTIINDFKDYIEYLLTHRNNYTNLTYAEDPTIVAYETGSELSGVNFGDMDVPNSWTETIADFVKELAPSKLIIDGTYGVNLSHLSLSNVDIYSDHYYPLSLTKLQDDISLVRSADKLFFAGEYAWTGADSFLDSLQAILDPATLTTLWNIIPSEYDGIEFFLQSLESLQTLFDTSNSALYDTIGILLSFYEAIKEYDATETFLESLESLFDPTLASFYNTIESEYNGTESAIIGDAFWSLFGHDVPNCNIYVNHSDGYTLHYNDPDNTVQTNTQIAEIRSHFFAMKDQSPGDIALPPVPCPGPLENLQYS